jgi:hypothetical protein
VKRLGVAGLVLAGGAEGEDDQALGSAVDELAADRRGDAQQFAGAQPRLLPLDEHGQLALDDEVDLLLVGMTMYAHPLPGRQGDLVDAKAHEPELAAQREQALVGVGPQAGAPGRLAHVAL